MGFIASLYRGIGVTLWANWYQMSSDVIRCHQNGGRLIGDLRPGVLLTRKNRDVRGGGAVSFGAILKGTNPGAGIKKTVHVFGVGCLFWGDV